jgi:hypothetical protein
MMKAGLKRIRPITAEDIEDGKVAHVELEWREF